MILVPTGSSLILPSVNLLQLVIIIITADELLEL